MEAAKGNTSETLSSLIEQWGSAAAQGLRITLFVLVLAVTLVANCTLIYITAIRSKTSSIRNVLLTSATTISLLLSLSTYGLLFLYGLHQDRRELGKPLCLLLCIVQLGCSTAFLLHLFTLLWQQLRSLASPMELQPRRPTIVIIIILLWLASFGSWNIYFGLTNVGQTVCSHWEKVITITVVVTLNALPFLATVLINVIIILLIRKISQSYQNIIRTEEQLRRQQRERRASLVLSICSSVFICCWLPMIITWILTDIVELDAPFWSFYITNMPFYVYPSIHPLLLFSIDLNLRKQLLSLVSGRKQIRPMSIQSQTQSQTVS